MADLNFMPSLDKLAHKQGSIYFLHVYLMQCLLQYSTNFMGFFVVILVRFHWESIEVKHLKIDNKYMHVTNVQKR